MLSVPRWGRIGGLVLVSTGMLWCQDRLVLISPHWEGIRVEFEQAFKNHYRRTRRRTVTFRWVDVGGTMAILRYIETSFRARPKGIGIDLMWGGGLDPFLRLKREGFLQKVKLSPQVIKKIPKTVASVPLYDREGYWYGAALSGFGIVYNKVVLRVQGLKTPKTWAELGDPKLFGWVEIADPRRSGSAHMMCEIILQAYGWEKGWEVLTCLFANARRITPGSEEPVTDVANGDVACAPSIDFYAWTKIAEVGDEILGFVYPPQLTVLNPDGIAMLKGAPHPRVAKAFMEFVLSGPGQRLWMLPTGAPGGPKRFTLARMSILPSLYRRLKNTVIKVNPFRFKLGWRYDPQKGDKRIAVLNSLIGALLVDTHRQLRQAWGRLIRKGTVSRTTLKWLCSVPISEEEALNLAERWGEDRSLAVRMEMEWVKFARRKYAAIR